MAFVAAALGFLPWNLRHRVFQGDVGAFFSALVIGGLGLVLASREAVTPFLVVFTALPLITDVPVDRSVVRARRRERLFEAHRDHLYQLWLRSTGRPHLALAVRVWALTALTTGIGLCWRSMRATGPSRACWPRSRCSVQGGFGFGLSWPPPSPNS
jgi:UDP-N-acetylmuramyl pentapeptide phosphotransferase/UDP-N-acetylglucosamine-1-phosphate transferase